jgi:SAM-dependent methyltransferase
MASTGTGTGAGTTLDSPDAENAGSIASSSLAPHPTAKAFFDALDAKRSSSKQSATLQKAAQSLGWRNRYSQNDQYPISMQTDHRRVEFSVQQIQRGEVEGTYGTGATVWPAAMVLLKYLERNPQLVFRKRVVDLGSGTGVTSLAAAILGAAHVVCTDGEDSVVNLASENCRVVPVGECPIKVQKYWWGTQPLPDDQCEVVLVADCVLPKLYPIAPLVQAIDELLSIDPDKNKNDAVAILSYEHRYYPDYDPRTRFRELAKERGLAVETIPLEHLDSVYSVDDIEIWHVTRR